MCQYRRVREVRSQMQKRVGEIPQIKAKRPQTPREGGCNPILLWTANQVWFHLFHEVGTPFLVVCLGSRAYPAPTGQQDENYRPGQGD